MCESGWEVSIIIFTGSVWGLDLKTYMASKTYCYKIKGPILIQYSTDVFKVQKELILNNLNSLDIIVDHDDDVLFKFSHVAAYIHELKCIQKSHTSLQHNLLPGFIDYHHNYRPIETVKKVEWREKNIYMQDTIQEYYNSIYPNVACLNGEPYLLYNMTATERSSKQSSMVNKIYDQTSGSKFWIIDKESLMELKTTCNLFSLQAYTTRIGYTFKNIQDKNYH